MSRCILLLLVIAGVACTARAMEEPRAANPVAGAGSAPLAAAPSAPTRVSTRRVFACHERGIAIFSDRPCGEVALQRDLVIRTPLVAGGGPPTTEPRAARAATRPKPEPKPETQDVREDARARAAARCRQLEHAVEALDDRMRTGYSAREAARLWQRWREAKERLRTADC